MENSIKQTVTEFKIEVVAKDEKKNVLGKGRCFAYSANEDGLAKAVKRFGYKSVVSAFNRQIKTDARNALARPKSAVKELIAMVKANLKLKETIIDAVRNSTELKDAEKNEIIALLTAIE